MRRLIPLILFLITAVTLSAQSGKINITLTDIKTKAGGRVQIGVFDKNNFPETVKETTGKIIDVKNSTEKVTLGDVPAGTYVIAVFQDKNSNGELDKNMFGMPTEPYGFSNNVRGKTGPPKFEDVSVEVFDGRSIDLSIRLK